MHHKFKRALLYQSLKIFDQLSIGGIFFFTTWFHFRRMENILFIDFLHMRISLINVILLMALGLLFWTIFMATHFYHSRRLEKIRFEIYDIIVAITLCTGLLTLWNAVFQISFIDTFFLLIFFGASVLWFTTSRLILRVILRRMRVTGRNLRHVVIAGTNARALAIARRLRNEPALGYHLLGFVDNKWVGDGMSSQQPELIVSSIAGFNAYLSDHVVDELILCLPLSTHYHNASLLAENCRAQGIIVRQMADLFDITKPDSGIIFFDIYDNQQHAIDLLIKRTVDIVVSVTALLFFLPLLAIVALLIKLDSSGPILFVQERLGLNKRRFKLYKFRTMVQGAEQMIDALADKNEMAGPAFKITHDPRMTNLGKWLRKYSIDELPQLLNVLKGDMSLVGPRPLPMRDYKGFTQDWYRRRFSVRPGITCLWQVGGRNRLTFDRWMELDMEYIDNWNLTVDFAILLRTIPAVLKSTGAS
jgi:exopolysaccharide biosynthesis polyprenyl glycosylphosphotransferase